MAVMKKKEVVVDQSLKQVYGKIENYYRTIKETTMKDRELSEGMGNFTVTYKKSMVSNGEVLSIHLEEIEDNKTKIKMVSESTVEKTKFDWGKNERNMKTLMEKIGVK